MSETTYLQNELAKTEKTIKVATIAMAIVLVVFIVYFQWMKAALAEVLVPETIAEFAINEARGVLPDLTESLKMNLTSEAPNVVHFVMTSAVDQALPLAQQSFETNLDGYSREVSTLGGEKLIAALTATLTDYKKQFPVTKKDDVAGIAKRMSAHVEAQLGVQLDTAAKEGVKQRLDSSGQTLKHINAELVSMARRPSGDRESELGRRLITTWWTFVDRGRPNIPGSEADPEALKKSVAAPKATN